MVREQEQEQDIGMQGSQGQCHRQWLLQSLFSEGGEEDPVSAYAPAPAGHTGERAAEGEPDTLLLLIDVISPSSMYIYVHTVWIYGDNNDIPHPLFLAVSCIPAMLRMLLHFMIYVRISPDYMISSSSRPSDLKPCCTALHCTAEYILR